MHIYLSHTIGTRAVIFLTALIVLYGCHRSDEVNPPLFSAEQIEVWPDSIKIDSLAVRATDFEESRGDSLPAYRSTLPLGDILWRKAMASQGRLSFTDIILYEALADPQKAMDFLRSKAEDGRIGSSRYPLVAPDFSWAVAAWEVYCLTGDREWLTELYEVVKNSIAGVMRLSVTSDGLLRGQSGYLSPAADFYPASWRTIDRFTSKSLGANAAFYGALKVAGQAAAEIGTDESIQWNKMAQDLALAINDTFWQPSLGTYGSIAYGENFPIVCPAPDIFGNLLCALLEISPAAMSERLSVSLPTAPRGATPFYPSPCPLTYPAELQALQSIVSAQVGSDGPFLASMAATWLAQSAEGGSRPWPAVVLKGIFGISFSPEGISMTPFVPSEMGSLHKIEGLPYRGAVLDIELTGTGNKVASVTLDGMSLPEGKAFIPSSLTGHHEMTIVLANNPLPKREAKIIAPPYPLPAAPKSRWGKGETVSFKAQQDSVKTIIVDGANLLVTTENPVDLKPLLSTMPAAPTHEVCIVANGKTPGVQGFSAPAHIIASSPDAIITVPSTAITPRRPPRQITIPELATQYIELAARHNTRLTLWARVAEAGEYDISIVYSNATSATALRTLSVNGRDIGTLICPPNDDGSWITTQHSTSLRAYLPEGAAHIALTYEQSATILLHSVRLIRR